MAKYIKREEAKKIMRDNGAVGEYKGVIHCVVPVSILDNIPAVDAVEVIRCKDCIHAIPLDKHCTISPIRYKNCVLWHGEETKNVWHKYGRYYKDYSLCSSGERGWHKI